MKCNLSLCFQKREDNPLCLLQHTFRPLLSQAPSHRYARRRSRSQTLATLNVSRFGLPGIFFLPHCHTFPQQVCISLFRTLHTRRSLLSKHCHSRPSSWFGHFTVLRRKPRRTKLGILQNSTCPFPVDPERDNKSSDPLRIPGACPLNWPRHIPRDRGARELFIGGFIRTDTHESAAMKRHRKCLSDCTLSHSMDDFDGELFSSFSSDRGSDTKRFTQNDPRYLENKRTHFGKQAMDPSVRGRRSFMSG
jgi:hypothetical protein